MSIMQSICKTARDAAGGVVSIWPFGSIVDSIWSIFLFPNDEWPDTSNGMVKCVLLNSGAYILALCLLGILAYSWTDIESVYFAHIAIFVSMGKVPTKRERVDEDDAL
jgi:arginine exporter protein ArgO